MRRIAALLALILGIGLLTACGSSGPTGASGAIGNEPAGSPGTPVPQLPATGVNADGSEIEITDISRIVPLWGNLSEIVFALGLGDNVVARDVAATFPEADGLPIISQGHDVSAETVLAQRPSLVLAKPDTGPPEAIDQIRKAGVPVLIVEEPMSVGGIEGLLEIPGIPQTPAGIARRIVTVEDGLLYSFGKRTPQTLTELIEAFHTRG